MALIDQLGLADQQEKLFRITYHVCTRLGRLFSRCEPGRRTARRLRVRFACRQRAGLFRKRWNFGRIFWSPNSALDVPILLALPVERQWLDATTGEPTSREFYSLRVTPEVLAIASEVPYDIDDEFRKAHQSTIEALMAA